MLVFFFSALAIRAVGKAALRRHRGRARAVQGAPRASCTEREKPDYGRAVDIVTRGALEADDRCPGSSPWARRSPSGLIFRFSSDVGAEAVAALLMVGTIAGILMATFLNNGGGAWDNAKKYIETGAVRRQGLVRAHKAAVVGDTVGDPFKDTAGPSLHVLIKLLATITLVLAPLFI